MTELQTRATPRVEQLLTAYAEAKARYARELGERRLVFPDATDFPDVYASDAPSAERLLSRMQHHAGMSDIPIALRVAPLGAELEASSCSSGACAPARAPSPRDFARVIDEGDSWTIGVPDVELRHPILLTTGLARALALIFVLETEEPGDAPPTPLRIELIAVLLGFGGLLLQGTHVYQKSCAGPRVDHFTLMNVDEAAFLTALMALDSGSNLKRLNSLVEVTQRAALSSAEDTLRLYPSFIRRLKLDPEAAAAFPPEPEAPKGLVNRLLDRVRGNRDEADDVVAFQKALAQRPQPKALPPRPSQDIIDLVKSEL